MDFLLSFIQTQPKYSGLAQYCPEALAELLSVRLCYSVESLVIFILAIVIGKSNFVQTFFRSIILKFSVILLNKIFKSEKSLKDHISSYLDQITTPIRKVSSLFLPSQDSTPVQPPVEKKKRKKRREKSI